MKLARLFILFVLLFSSCKEEERCLNSDVLDNIIVKQETEVSQKILQLQSQELYESNNSIVLNDVELLNRILRMNEDLEEVLWNEVNLLKVENFHTLDSLLASIRKPPFYNEVKTYLSRQEVERIRLYYLFNFNSLLESYNPIINSVKTYPVNLKQEYKLGEIDSVYIAKEYYDKFATRPHYCEIDNELSDLNYNYLRLDLTKVGVHKVNGYFITQYPYGSVDTNYYNFDYVVKE